MYPPVPSAQVRVVPLGGRYIAGEYVPAGVRQARQKPAPPPLPSCKAYLPMRIMKLIFFFFFLSRYFVKTLVEVQQWSINHSPDNWSDPWAFRPERFLCDGTGSNGDALQALQPFSIGPRNCIGRKLVTAYLFPVFLESCQP